MNLQCQAKCAPLFRSGWWLLFWLCAAPLVQAAVYFPGDFAPGANWQANPDKGTVVFSSASTGIVITGPGGTPSGHVRDSFDVMNYVGPSGGGLPNQTTITFHYRLDPGNSLAATATFMNGGNTVVLASSGYGGGAIEGDFTAVIPQYGQFAFGLDSQIYKFTAATLTITALRPIPEPGTYWAGGIICLAMAGRFGWKRKRRSAEASAPVPS